MRFRIGCLPPMYFGYFDSGLSPEMIVTRFRTNPAKLGQEPITRL